MVAGHVRLLLLLAPVFLLAGAGAVAADLLGEAPAAATGFDYNAAAANPVAAACEANSLATQLALFCRHGDNPTASCCEPLVASVDLTGGVACLFRVSTQPQLLLAGVDATRLLALYAACGGQRAGGPHLAADYKQGETPPPPPLQQPGGAAIDKQIAVKQVRCDSMKLAALLQKNCGDTPLQSRSCCRIVVKTVDGGRDCLCNVANEPAFSTSSLSLRFMWTSYKACGGRRQVVPKDMDSCYGAPAPPPPPSRGRAWKTWSAARGRAAQFISSSVQHAPKLQEPSAPTAAPSATAPEPMTNSSLPAVSAPMANPPLPAATARVADAPIADPPLPAATARVADSDEGEQRETKVALLA